MSTSVGRLSLYMNFRSYVFEGHLIGDQYFLYLVKTKRRRPRNHLRHQLTILSPSGYNEETEDATLHASMGNANEPENWTTKTRAGFIFYTVPLTSVPLYIKLYHMSTGQSQLSPTISFYLMWDTLNQSKLALRHYRSINTNLIKASKNGLHPDFLHLDLLELNLASVKYPPPLAASYQLLRTQPSRYARLGLPPSSVKEIKDVVLEQIPVRIFIPNKHEGGRCLIYFHGGGFILGDEKENPGLLTKMCDAAKCVVVSVQYPLAPEAQFPAPVRAGREVLAWLRSYGREILQIDPRNMGLIGISAGATIAAVLAFEDAIQSPAEPLLFQVLWAPMIKLTAGQDEPSRQGVFQGLTASRAFEYLSLSVPQEGFWRDLFFDSRRLRGFTLPTTLLHSPREDCLHMEGLQYAQHLRAQKQVVQLFTWVGMPHHALDVLSVTTANRAFMEILRGICDGFTL